MSNVLDLVDQSFFRLEQAAGVGQCVWVYDRPVDIDGLRRFHEHLQRGRLSRRIERSPLPFGRHRWVSPSDQPELEIVATPRPREEFDAWLDEQANIPLDAEHGPGWHLAMLPFTDGGAAVSLVLTHCLTDGIGGCVAMVEAACGYDSAIDWPAAGSRRRWQALRQDARQTVRDIPAIGRAAVAAARFARRNRGRAGSATPPPAPLAGVDELISAPNGDDLSRCRRVGRPRRLTRGDQQHAARGIGGPPRPASGTRRRRRLGHLGHARQRARRRRYSRQRRRDGRHHGRPCTRGDGPARDPRRNKASADPPPGGARRTAGPAAPRSPAASAGHPADGQRGHRRCDQRRCLIQPRCGSPGRQPSQTAQTPSHVALLSRYPGVTKAMMHQLGGLLVVHSARVHRQVFVSVLGYQPGRPNSNDDLRRDLSRALSDFSLTPAPGWECPTPVDAAR